MSRSKPAAPPRVVNQPNPNVITQVREYRLITPLYGGGVEAGRVDRLTPISGKGIRGQLRFWWRATRGADKSFEKKMTEMRKRENAVWGAAASKETPITLALPTQLYIELLDGGKPFEVTARGQTVDIGHFRSPYSYVAFPLRESRAAVYRDLRFRLHITFHADFRTDIEAALWAWETFGGIGARTRRGFGAVQLVGVDGVPHSLPLNRDEAVQQIRDGIRTHVRPPSGAPPETPVLMRDFRVTQLFPDANEAWLELITALRDFRQQRSKGTGNRPGRSYWSEPDAIRHYTGKTTDKHSARKYMFNKFPRAAFGLPIIFQFKDASVDGDPEPTTLVVNDKTDRWASPLILRPIACVNGQAVGLAVVLANSDITKTQIHLEVSKGVLKPVKSTLDIGEATTLSKAVEGFSGSKEIITDVLKAFLNFL